MSKYQAFESATLPENYRDSIVKMKRILRAQIGDVQGLFAEVSEFIAGEIASIKAQEAQTGSGWPVLEFADIAAGKVTAEQLALIKRRGCVVIRNHFPREQVLQWDQGLLDYLDRNRFDAVYRGPVDQFFGNLEASRPEIFPIYWSASQMQLRQHERMGTAQAFLNDCGRLIRTARTGSTRILMRCIRTGCAGVRRAHTQKALGRTPIPGRWSAGCIRRI